jgi:hypothetical protein
MLMRDKDDKKQDLKKLPEKRPYVKPAITTEEIFERQALACQGKTQSCERPPFSRQGS